MDRLDAIRTFLAVVDNKNFSRAAEQLGHSRLQVSRQVKSLEDWLQTRLLHRTTRSLSLTESGEKTLTHFESILNHMTALELDTHRNKTKLQGAIRITAPIGLAQNLLLHAITAFNALHPEVKFELQLSDTHDDLAQHGLDLALRYCPQPNEHLIARRLNTIGFVLCASKKYLAQAGTPTEPLHLLGHNCLIHLDQSRWHFSKNDNPYPIDVKGTLKANDLAVLLNATLLGLGIAALPCDLANPQIIQGKLVPVMADYQLGSNALWVVYLSRSYQQARVRAFIDFLAVFLKEDLLPLNQ
ncbi:LysR family transcriptional regulator [Shewanella youngdeokensis]|uniref:LysR family transcriptional regulator n=1 Tax=Shewanella youngdeokensis TaxID=2999068 RepID=A0ABZ0K3Y3_9GAMM|nr:LysR family transcriptional regulator [Shewanella sp. DAU334]